MKSSDFARVDEGVWDNIKDNAKGLIARSGIQGKRAQAGAVDDRRRQLSYNIGLQQFTKALSSGLETAISSGLVDKTIGQSPAAQQGQPTTQGQAAPAAQSGASGKAPAAKLTPQQQAAMKAKLQGQRAAGATTATQTGQGFKNYVKAGGERMAGADKKGAPVFKKVRESFNSKFDSILEGIIAEQPGDQSISQYVQSFFISQARKEKLNVSDNVKATLISIADQIQRTYPTTNRVGGNESKKLWDLLWALSQANDREEEGGGQQPSNSPQQNAQRSQWYDSVVKSLQQIDINKNDPATIAALNGVIKSLTGYVNQMNQQAQQQKTP